METAICPAHGSRYPWAQDCPECTKEARRLGMSVDRYYSNVRPFLASERLKDRPMTSEIKPEDVKLPEPVAYMTEHEQGPMLWLDRREALSYSDEETPPIELVTADQVRAAVLAERERCAQVCDRLGNSEYPTDPDDCATAIRSGK